MTPIRDTLNDGPVVYSATWRLTPDDPEGDPVDVAAWDAKSLQVEGRLVPPDEVVVLGSNSGHGWADLATVTYPDLLQLPLLVGGLKVRLSAKSSQTAVTVTLIGHRR